MLQGLPLALVHPQVLLTNSSTSVSASSGTSSGGLVRSIVAALEVGGVLVDASW